MRGSITPTSCIVPTARPEFTQGHLVQVDLKHIVSCSALIKMLYQVLTCT